MKLYKKLTLFFLVFPLFVFAHGQEVLIPLGIFILTFLGFILLLWLIKISLKKKGMLFIIFLVSSFIVGYYTATMPFSDNEIRINIFSFVPLLISGISYLIIKKR